MKKFEVFLAQLGPIGRSRYAPGTMGSFVALWLAPLCLLPFPFWGRLLVLTALFFLGVRVADTAEKELGKKDPSSVIIDEVMGQWIALMPLPTLSYWSSEPILFYQFMMLIAGFMLFRIFDITKVGPVGMAERHFQGGLGIMMDDIVAGFFAALFMWPITYYLHLLFYY